MQDSLLLSFRSSKVEERSQSLSLISWFGSPENEQPLEDAEVSESMSEGAHEDNAGDEDFDPMNPALDVNLGKNSEI